jgi:hypothetical protein
MLIGKGDGANDGNGRFLLPQGNMVLDRAAGGGAGRGAAGPDQFLKFR